MYGRSSNQRLARTILTENILENRDPSLINLPGAIPSIPVLSPLLSPLVSGDDSPESSPSSQIQAPSSTGPSQPSASPSNPATGSNGSSNGSGTNLSSGGENTSSQNDGSTSSRIDKNTSSSTLLSGNNANTNAAGAAASSATPSHAINAIASSRPSTTNALSDANQNSNVIGQSATSKSFSATGTSPVANVAPDTTSTSFVAGGSDHPEVSSSSGVSSGGFGGSSITDPSSHSLSRGAIAGITICCSFIVAALLVVLVRRRSEKRRAARLNHWRAISSGNFDFSSPESLQSNGSTSQRSSFATSYDISYARGHSAERLPDIPPMVEIRDAHGPGFLTHAQATDEFSGNLMANLDNSNRWSTGSDPHSQFLVRPPPEAATGGGTNLKIPPSPTSPTRMSVRPFSPTELFSFPKPPKSLAGGTVNPFEDPVHIHEFSESEIVRRPFVPSLDDELWVEADERVRILRIFSDGWALVEKVSDNSGKGKGAQSPSPGLIPVDCFRQADQTNTALAVKAERVSSCQPKC
ncbi:hypothetical protein GYMLUDRAFT_236302 [Collybiopsis luxurians FD-317 M1]|nr:hypothetical protein GYMLUDRAFT_236302 [Collybiopsis luxurians FD-317 M1]